MRLASISITNLTGFKDFQSQLHAVSLIEGDHGKGKSSLEKIIMYMMGRRPLADKGSRSVQHDPQILKSGEDAGEAILTFSDDTDAEFLRVRVKPDSTERKIKMRGKRAWEDASVFIDDITSALAYNPMQLTKMEPKERLEAFLRVSPPEITHAEVIAAVGEHVELPEKPGLDTINALHDAIYKLRTAENTAVATQEAYASQLYAALPPAAESGDWNTEVAKLREDKSVLEASEAEEVARIGKEFQSAKDQCSAWIENTNEAIDKRINQRISELESERQSDKVAALKVSSTDIESARTKANAEVTELRTNNAPLHEALTTKIATADERARSAAQAEGTREAAAKARAEAADRRSKASRMTQSLQRLTELKATVGGRMKIPGVTIAAAREGQPVDICREEDGALVPFSVWNDADKDAFCLRMAVLHSGPCGLVCVDNTGNWNEDRRNAVIARCKVLAEQKGMQFLLGVPSGGDLRVTDAGGNS